MKKAYIYTRVSTGRQGRSGLGLDAQKKACLEFAAQNNIEVLDIVVETQSGKHADRPILKEAMRRAKADKGSIILVAKLCRLSRSVADISRWMAEGIPFVVCELGLEVPSFMLHIYASFAQLEREQIGKRTSAALQEAKKRGVKLGASIESVKEAAKKGRLKAGKQTLERVAPFIMQAKAEGITTQQKIADYLNDRRVLSPRGKLWSQPAIRKVLKRMDESSWVQYRLEL